MTLHRTSANGKERVRIQTQSAAIEARTRQLIPFQPQTDLHRKAIRDRLETRRIEKEADEW